MVAKGLSEELKVAVEVWRNNPFSPHAIARLRTTAYQKTVVMKYIDNLIAWGDQLFRRETLESINEATQLYVLAAEILGRRPEVIERNLKPAVQTFNSLDLEPGGLGNALEQIELLISDAGGPGAAGDSSETPDPPSDTILYFCVPENDQLLGYWSTVADRLFKLRHCMNIEGQVRQLPLFEPPIDPALLVRARAAGLSIGEVLSDIDVSLPNYRFSVMAQKANELVAEVRNLGAACSRPWKSGMRRRCRRCARARSCGCCKRCEMFASSRLMRRRRTSRRCKRASRWPRLGRSTTRAARSSMHSRKTSLLLLSASAVPIEISAHLRVLAGLLQKFGSIKARLAHNRRH